MKKIQLFRQPVFIIISVITLALLAWIYFTATEIAKSIKEDARSDAKEALHASLLEARKVFERNEQQCIVSAQQLLPLKKDSLALKKTLSFLISNNPELDAAFCHFSGADSSNRNEVYLKRGADIIHNSPFNNHLSAMKRNDIYKKLERNPQPYWENSHYSAVNDRVDMIYIVPIWDAPHQVGGFIGIRMNMNWITGVLEKASARYHNDPYAFMLVLDKTGIAVSMYGNNLFDNRNIIRASEEQDGAFASLLHHMRNGDTEAYYFTSETTGVSYELFFAPLHNRNLSFAIAFHQYQLIKTLRPLLWISIALIIILYLFVIFRFSKYAKKKNASVNKINETLNILGTGELDIALSISLPDRDLSRVMREISDTKNNLSSFIKGKIITNRKQEKIENERSISKNIRNYFDNNALSYISGVAVKKLMIEIRSNYLYKDIGGDFHDYFNIAPDRVCIVAGTVSRSNELIQTSVDVLITMNLIRCHIVAGKSLSQCVEELNHELIRQNKYRFTVELTVMVINCTTGEMEFINTGMPPAFHIAKRNIALFDTKHGLPLASTENRKYSFGYKKLQKNDALLIYTSGVLNRKNYLNETFGAERLAQLIPQIPSDNPTFFINELSARLNAFSTNQPHQVDDCTLCMVKYMDEK